MNEQLKLDVNFSETWEHFSIILICLPIDANISLSHPFSFIGNISSFKQPGLVTHVNYLLNKLNKKKKKCSNFKKTSISLPNLSEEIF